MMESGYFRRQRLLAFRRQMEAQADRRAQMIEHYSEFHSRTWLESLSYVELICLKNAGRLDRPALPGMREEEA